MSTEFTVRMEHASCLTLKRLGKDRFVEIQQSTFGLQDAQLVIAREYGFASWTRLKEQALQQEQSTESMSPKDVLFQILRTDNIRQSEVQRVETLLTAEPSLISERDENGQTPVQVLAARKIVHSVKNTSLQRLYFLLLAHGAIPDIVATIVMDDVNGFEAQISSNPRILKQQFDLLGNWRGISLLAIAARYARTEIAKILIEADPSLVTEGQAEGKAPMDLLVKPWHHSAFEVEPRKPFYNLLVENGAVPDLGAALVMDDWTRAGAYVTSNPQLLAQQFVCGNQIELRPIEIADECLTVVETLLEAEADVHRNYRVDIDDEILELTPLTYTQKLASMFPDKPFEKVIEALLRNR